MSKTSLIGLIALSVFVCILSPSAFSMLPSSVLIPHEPKVGNKIVSSQHAIGRKASFLLEEGEIINQRLNALLYERQEDFVAAICDTGTSPFPNLLGLVEASVEEILPDFVNTCVKNLKNIWQDPKSLERVAALDSHLAQYLDRGDSLHRMFFTSSLVKVLRLNISQDYFRNVFIQRSFDHIKQHFDSKFHTDLRSLLETAVFGLGFNRIFSSRSMIASPASDIDFKVIYDSSAFEAIPFRKLLVETDGRTLLESAIREELLVSKREFSEKFGMELEVSDFTVQALKKVYSYFETREEGELNFYSSIALDHSYLFGNKDLYEQFKQFLLDSLSLSEIQLRTFEQFLGFETSKVSIGQVIYFNQLLADIKSEESKSILERLIARPLFRGLNLIGMGHLNEKEHKDNWVFSTKYSLVRLYDYSPLDRKTRVLGKIGIFFQFLKVYVLRANGMTTEEIGESYDTISSNDFYQISRLYPREVSDLAQKACSDDLVDRSLCDHLDEALISQERSSLNRVGFLFFTVLFQKAEELSVALSPKENPFSPRTVGRWVQKYCL